MDIKIRRARLEEAGILTELSLRTKQSNGYDDAFMAACREELTVTGARMSQGEYWVAESEGIRGCACLLADPENAPARSTPFSSIRLGKVRASGACCGLSSWSGPRR